MSKRATRSRIYWREQGGERRAYGDFRDYRDVGGRQEALKPAGQKQATADPTIAAYLLGKRIEDLEARRHGRLFAAGPGVRTAMLGSYAAAHLTAKAKTGRVTDDWLEASERHLRRAIEHLGADRELSSIDVEDVRLWAEALGQMETRSARPMTGGTIKHHLNTLSNLFRHAASERRVPTSYNPVRDLLDKPQGRRVEARWLEVPDAALLLEACRTYQSKRPDLVAPFLYALVATYLLTGGRRKEVLGLEVSDVNFERRIITFRPNAWRRLKTPTSHRSVPLWPQLEAILRAYLSDRTARQVLGNEPTRTLLFPGEGPQGEALISDFRKVLDGAALRAGFSEPRVRRGEVMKDKGGTVVLRSTISVKMFRHTYCAARLQTLDHGAPVSVYTVAREMGHGGDSLVKRIYGHLGELRHRSDVMEYRTEQHEARLGERLTALSEPSEDPVTRIVTDPAGDS